MAMPKIEFRLQMFRGDWDQVWSQRRMLWAMEALCRCNQTHIFRMSPPLSFCGSSGSVPLPY